MDNLVKIKEEVDPLPVCDTTLPDDKNILYDLVKVKKELDHTSTDDNEQIYGDVLKECKQENEEKSVVPIEMLHRKKQLLHTDIKDITPDPSPISQNDTKIPKCKHLSSGNGSASVTFREIAKQESLDVQHILKLSICDKSIEKGDKDSETASTDNTFTSTVYNVSNPKPTVSKEISNLNAKSNHNAGDSDGTCLEEMEEAGSTSNKVTDENTSEIRKKEDAASNNNATLINTYEYFFCCKKCNKKFNRKSKLRAHEKSKCGSIKLFACNICVKGFLHKDSLLNHRCRDYSSEVSKPFKCDICDKSYSTNITLRNHKRMNHIPKQDTNMVPQTCEYCQNSYPSMIHLKDHMRRQHGSSKHFECAHCSQVFKYKKSIVVHLQSMHLQERLPKCTFCNRVFSSDKSLQDHLKSNICKKKLVCDQCGKMFKCKYSLSNHLRAHSNEKLFVCQTCGKAFTTDSNLIQHSVTHSDLRPFSCDICFKSFRIRNHLRQHMSVHGLVNTVVKHRQIRKN